MTKRRAGGKIIFENLNIMKYKNLGIGLAVIAGILVWQIISIAGTKSNFPDSASGNDGIETQLPVGQVSVEANYLPGKSEGDKIAFEVALNTHSVNLNDIDFQKTVVMQVGGKTFASLTAKVSGADHHRSAELIFSMAGVPLKIIFLGTEAVERKEFEFEKLK